MLPAHPPLPTPWNFPFQPCSGIQTSILMSESRVGVRVAATRQNAGSFAAAGGTAPPGPCGENWPAPTTMACVTVTFVSDSDLRLSQVAADAGNASVRTAMLAAAAPAVVEILMTAYCAPRRRGCHRRFFVDTVLRPGRDERRADVLALMNRWAPRMRSRSASGETRDSRTRTHG